MKVLFFAPYAAIWQHASLEIAVAERLESQGYATTFLQCDELFHSPCISMQAFGFREGVSIDSRNAVCKECKFNSSLIKSNKNRRVLSINDFITEEDTIEIEKLISEITVENWMNWNFKGLAIGSYASYEFMLNHKLISEDIPSHLWETYLSSVRNSLLACFALERLLDHSDFQIVISYNRMYSTNRSISELAKLKGIQSISLSAFGPMDDMYGRILMTYDDRQIMTFNRSETWNSLKDEPLSVDQLRLVEKHLKAILEGNSPWVYSSKASNSTELEIRTKLKISSGSKIILLALSSADEVFAAGISGILPANYGRDLIFSSQNDWVRHIIAVADNYPDSHFVIRVHPREFPNKRESVLSNNASELMSLAAGKIPKNVSFNFPKDDISLYDFVPIVDRLLTANSSVGIEFSAFGVPVISHNASTNTNIPDDILYSSTTLDEYHKLLDSHFDDSRHDQIAKYTFRWIYFRNFQLSSKVSLSHSQFVQRVLFHVRQFALQGRLRGKLASIFLNLFWEELIPKFNGALDFTHSVPTFTMNASTPNSELLEFRFIVRFQNQWRRSKSRKL